MRAAPLDHSRAAGPQAEDWDAGMDVQNVKVAASSGCPEIQIVALALHIGVQICAPSEFPDIRSAFLTDLPPLAFVANLIFPKCERVFFEMLIRQSFPPIFPEHTVRNRVYKNTIHQINCNFFIAH